MTSGGYQIFKPLTTATPIRAAFTPKTLYRDNNGELKSALMVNARYGDSYAFEKTLNTEYDSKAVYELYKSYNAHGQKGSANALENTVFRFEVPSLLSVFTNLEVFAGDKVTLTQQTPAEAKNSSKSYTITPVDVQNTIPVRAGVTVPLRPYVDNGNIKKVHYDKNVQLLKHNEELLAQLGGPSNNNSGVISSYTEIKEDGLYIKKGYIIYDSKEPNLDLPDGSNKPSTPPIDYYNSQTRKKAIELNVVADRREALSELKDKVDNVNKFTNKYRNSNSFNSTRVHYLNYDEVIKEFTQYHEEMVSKKEKAVKSYIQNIKYEIEQLSYEKQYLTKCINKTTYGKTNNTVLPADCNEETEDQYITSTKSDNGINPEIKEYSDADWEMQNQIVNISLKIGDLEKLINKTDYDSLPEVQGIKKEFETKMQGYISSLTLGTVYIDSIEKTEDQIKVEEAHTKNPGKYEQYKLELSEEDMDVLTHAHEIIKGYETAEVREEKRNATKKAKEVFENFKEYTLNGFITPDDKEYLEMTDRKDLNPEYVSEIKAHSKQNKKLLRSWERTYNQKVRQNWFNNLGVEIKENINSLKGVPYLRLDGGLDLHLRHKSLNKVGNSLVNAQQGDEMETAMRGYIDGYSGKSLIKSGKWCTEYAGISGFGEIGCGYANPYFDVSGGVVFRGGNRQVFDGSAVYQTVSPFVELSLRKIGQNKKHAYSTNYMAPIDNNRNELTDAKLLSKYKAECALTARMELIEKQPVVTFGLTLSAEAK